MSTVTTENRCADSAEDLYRIVYRAVADAIRASVVDLELGLQQEARRETVRFIRDNLPLHLGCPGRQPLLLIWFGAAVNDRGRDQENLFSAG